MADLANAWIAANVEETSAGRLRVGQSVHIDIDEGGQLLGHVDVVASSAASQFALIPVDNGAGDFTKIVQRIPIRVAVDPLLPSDWLRVRQSVTVKIRVR